MRRSLTKEQEALGEILKQPELAEIFGKNQNDPRIGEAVSKRAYGYAKPVFEEEYGIPETERKIDQATKTLTDLTIGSYDINDLLTKSFKEMRPEFTGTKSDLMKSYVKKGVDPFTAEELANRDVAGRRSILSDVLSRAGNIYGKQVAGAELGLNALRDTLGQQQSRYDEAVAPLQAEAESEAEYADFVNRELFQHELAKDLKATPSAGSGSSSYLDQYLSASDAERFGVPFGTKRADVVGMTTGQTTKRFEDFASDLILPTNQSNVDPKLLYQDYLESQQLIDLDPSKFNEISNDPVAAPFAHLLKPKTADPLQAYIRSVLNQSLEGAIPTG